jgi:TRAP transporter TAXI family solute receptor
VTALPFSLRCSLLVLTGLMLASLTAPSAIAQQTLLRIGTGGGSGTYFPIGSLIARATSAMPVGPGCAAAQSRDGQCGLPGLLAVAQTSNGSVANVASLQSGEIEVALVQADVATWAYGSKEIYANRPSQDRLRFVAHLYSEAMHVVVRKQSGVTRIGDLRGRPVALDEPGSGSLIHVRNLLGAYNLSETDLRGQYVKPDLAVPQMLAGQLDAFFIVAGWPVKTVANALASGTATLLPLDATQVRGVMQRNPFLSFGSIPAGSYAGQPEIPTLMVGAQLIVRDDLSDDLIAGFLEAMWSERGQEILRSGHPRGGDIRFPAALTGRSIPLHPGAERFYRARGLPTGG